MPIAFPRAPRTAALAFLPLVLFLSGFAGPGVLAQLRNWRTYTDMSDVRQLAAVDGKIFGATSGGLLVFSPATQAFAVFNNANGLAANDITAIAVDKLGRVWLGLSDGSINIFDPVAEKFDLIIDYKDFEINAIFAAGDTVYIALDIGVGEYRIEKNEPKELYRQLGLNFNREVAATSLLVQNGKIYVGTLEGLAIADLAFPNLKAPQSWQNLTTASGLPDGAITGLAVFDHQVVVATPRGIAVEQDSGWLDISQNLPEKDIQAIAVRESALETVLFVATRADVYRTSDLTAWRRIPDFPGKPADLLIADGVLWAASEGTGLVEYNEQAAEWQVHRANSPKTNSYSGLAIDKNGALWAVSSIDGFLSFDGESWENYESLGSLARGDYRTVLVDPQNRIWMGTWGKGITLLDRSETGLKVTKIDTTGGILAGSTPDDPGFPVVNDLTLDRHGNVWLSNIGAINGRQIAVVTPENQWAYFDPGTAKGVSGLAVFRIIVDQFDRVWYGTASHGVEEIDYGGTLFDATDDNPVLGLVPSSELFSSRITGLAEDQDGTVWIGTNEGLNFWFSNQVSRQFRLISNDIRIVRVDPANNKWIGTAGGISVLLADNATLVHYTTENSPLVSNSVTDFAFNPETGEIFIGTTNGLSAVSSPFTQSRFDFALLKGYPNPFVVDGTGKVFTITNLIRQSGVSIYAEDGQLVREFPPGTVPGAQVEWDGKDSAGEYVASGIYIFVAFTQDGGNAAGKVALIRK